MGKERSIVLCIIFTIITCGIYGIYWMIVLNDDMLDALEEEGTSGGMVFLFSLITCGIYGLYWIYQMGKRVDRLNDRAPYRQFRAALPSGVYHRFTDRCVCDYAK